VAGVRYYGYFAPLSGQEVYPALAKKLVAFQVLVSFMRGSEFHEKQAYGLFAAVTTKVTLFVI
jgi:hypothetical protein